MAIAEHGSPHAQQRVEGRGDFDAPTHGVGPPSLVDKTAPKWAGT